MIQRENIYCSTYIVWQLSITITPMQQLLILVVACWAVFQCAKETLKLYISCVYLCNKVSSKTFISLVHNIGCIAISKTRCSELVKYCIMTFSTIAHLLCMALMYVPFQRDMHSFVQPGIVNDFRKSHFHSFFSIEKSFQQANTVLTPSYKI